MRHLNVCLYGMYKHGDKRHAQTVMHDLGITYRYAVPQSLGDCWWFLDCRNVPDELPEFVSEMVGFKPHEVVGYGLSQEMADALEPRP